MTTDATIGRVSRPRGVLTEEQLRALDFAHHAMVQTEANYRAMVVRLLVGGCSFSEVSKATGLSTNTLQRWKREARGGCSDCGWPIPTGECGRCSNEREAGK